MDEWESLRLKIKELETNFLRGSAPAGISTQEVPGAEYWKKKFDEERLTWQKALEEKDREQSILQERYVKDEEGVSLLIQKIGTSRKNSIPNGLCGRRKAGSGSWNRSFRRSRTNGKTGRLSC